jgi:DUF2075 family protein
MTAFYEATIPAFLSQSVNEIVGALTSKSASAGFSTQLHAQTEAWAEEIFLLKAALGNEQLTSGGYVLLEYTIPRRDKRIDAVVIAHDILFVIEFKIGSALFNATDISQVEDYALDLRDFHEQSFARVIVPVLVATETDPRFAPETTYTDFVKPVVRANAKSLESALAESFLQYSNPQSARIDPASWSASSYRPTPTIIEAAQSLYAGKNVREIARSHAEAKNLTETTNAVIRAINEAKASNAKLICFVTGVPGAGKTLAGLNIVHNSSLHEEDLGVFLSGNGPLVKVLREALARDHVKKTKAVKKNEALRKVRTFIQNVHGFLDAYYTNEKVPVDRIVVFDEAQRAWNAEQSFRKFKRNCSEPEMMLEIMDRHPDWAVIVALVGGGQEINSGEAGLFEWGRTLEYKFPHWQVLISPQLLKGHHSTAGQGLFAEVPKSARVSTDAALHLNVSLRAYRAERLSEFVAHLLEGDTESCKTIFEGSLQDYPLFVTRKLSTAQEWLKLMQRGTRRIGMIASSGERRIKPYGYDVTRELDVENWFLNPKGDVRSSYALEDVATEFGIQGLELDWTCVCWGADFRYNKADWTYRKFRGTNWQNVNDAQTRQYVKNKYRVLLTRAREGMVIWVPQGEPDDSTRLPEFYDSTAQYLFDCGIKELQ